MMTSIMVLIYSNAEYIPQNMHMVLLCTLSYYHHQIGSMTHLPSFRVRSWNSGMCFMSFYNLKVPSHLDVWRERVNIVWENHQHVQKRTWVPVNHLLACSKHVSNVSKTTYHRVNTVWVTFSQRFHSVCERVPTCQTSVQRVLNVYVTCE